MIKALACDIDGTITDEKRRLNLQAVALLRNIEELGVPVVLATGNILCLTEAACAYIGLSGPIIAENGGVVKNQSNGETLYLCKDRGELDAAFEHLRNERPVRLLERSELRKTEIAIHRDVDPKDVKEIIKEFKVRVVDTKYAIHLLDPNISKGEALSLVADMMGLKHSEFAAIGDSENDFEMLKKAGFSISVGEEKLRDVSRVVTSEGFGEGGVEALKYIISNIKSD